MIPQAFPIRFLVNQRADPALPYGPGREEVLSRDAHENAFQEISTWKGYSPTPLMNMEATARKLGVGSLWYKDEGARLGLGSFKALGGILGVLFVLQSRLEEQAGLQAVSSQEFARGPLAALLAGVTVTCASAGNHGKAVARGAQMFGCKAVVFLPSHTSPHRVEAIRKLGARTIFVDGSFDDAVALAAREAEANGWHVVADTTYPGYEEVPRHIMQGYTVLAREVLDQLPQGVLPSHVFLQAGVGGLAAAVTGHFWDQLGDARPRTVVVEPADADCLLESALVDGLSESKGSLLTSMECLACRRVSSLAWKILAEGAHAFLSISDQAAAETVKFLAEGRAGDPPILTQPSGAAGLAGLLVALYEPGLAGPLGLSGTSRVLVIGSEGPA